MPLSIIYISEADLEGGVGGSPSSLAPSPPLPPPFISNDLFFFDKFEELETVLIEVKLIINNAPLTYV